MKSDVLNKNMTPSKENYLKVLLELSGGKEVHSSDVANALGVTRASVSCMMKRLRDEGYVVKEKYGAVSLTEKGLKEAANVKRRYNLLKLFFVRILGVDTATAAEDACRIEHIISPESISKIHERLNCI
ncbi:metal-dependent transcriptional regulator [Caproicibacter fermentans]|nr:metal-dependent transcriptional regulator [Caproicibacter fermentans]